MRRLEGLLQGSFLGFLVRVTKRLLTLRGSVRVVIRVLVGSYMVQVSGFRLRVRGDRVEGLGLGLRV